MSRGLLSATNSLHAERVAAGGTFAPKADEVKDVRAQGGAAGTITITDNGGEAITFDVNPGDFIGMRGKITVTGSTVPYIVYK